MRLAKNLVLSNFLRKSIPSSPVISLLSNRHQSNWRFESACTCTCGGVNSNSKPFSPNASPLLQNQRSYFVERNYSVDIPSTNNTPSGPNGNGSDAKGRTRTLDQVVYHLQADIRRKRRIHKADIHNAIELVEEASKVDNFGAFLLNCCSDILPDLHPTYRVKLAERIWAVIRKGNEYSITHFEAMLKALALNEDARLDPVKYLEEAKSAGLNLTGTMYFFALLILCQRGDLASAVKILTDMKENMIPVNERFFNALMLGNLRAGDYKGATDMLEIMRASHIEPSKHTWCTLLQIHIEMSDLNQIRKMFSEVIGSPFTEDQFYDLLKVAGKQSSQEVLDLVIDKALKSGNMHALSVMSLILQLTHLGYFQNAMKMILRFENILRTRSEALGTFFIRELHSANNISDKDHDIYLNLIISLQGTQRNPYALNTAAEYCLKQKKFELAYKIFDAMLHLKIPVRPHYFLPAFVSAVQDNGVTGGITVLRKMNELDVKPDWEMISNWVVPIMFVEEPNMVKTLKTIHEVSGLSYSSGGLFSAGLIVALREKNLEAGLRLIENCNGKIFYPDEVMQSLFDCICDPEVKQWSSVTEFIKCICEKKPSDDRHDYVGEFILKLLESDRGEEAEILLKDVAEFRIPVSEKAAEIIMENVQLKCKLEVDFQLTYGESGIRGKNIMQLANKTTSSLECHKVELESKGMNARGTHRKLFLKYCSSRNLDKVLESKADFERDHGPLSQGMKAALMGVYIGSNMLEPAMELFEELCSSDSHTDVVIDVYKIIDLATLMVENRLIDEAVDIINQKCPSRVVRRPETISRNIIKLLEACSKSTPEDSECVCDLTQLFLKLRYIKPFNPTLAPSIKDRIHKNDLEGAVTLMEEYSTKYSLSPSLQELTYAVIDNPTLLERVVKCSTLTRGEREAKRLLALARADMGDIDGAARGLQELGDDLSFLSIIKQCEYLGSKNQIGKILNLIKAMQKTGQNYDCRRLYDIAIDACKNWDNKEELKRILSDMEDQDVFISTNLKKLSSQK